MAASPVDFQIEDSSNDFDFQEEKPLGAATSAPPDAATWKQNFRGTFGRDPSDQEASQYLGSPAVRPEVRAAVAAVPRPKVEGLDFQEEQPQAPPPRAATVPFSTNPRTGQRTPITDTVIPPSISAAASGVTAPMRRGAHVAGEYIASEAASLDPNSFADVQVPSLQRGGKPTTISGPMAVKAYKNVVAPAAESAAGFLEGTYEPKNLAMLGALGTVRAGTTAAKAINAAAVAYFLPSSVKGAIEQGTQAVEAGARGDVPGAVRSGTAAAIDTLFTAAIGGGAVRAAAAKASGMGADAYTNARGDLVKSLTDYAVKKQGGNPEDVLDATPARRAAEQYLDQNGFPGQQPAPGVTGIPENVRTAGKFRSAAERVRGTGAPVPAEPRRPVNAPDPVGDVAQALTNRAQNSVAASRMVAAAGKAVIPTAPPAPPAPPAAPPPPMVNDRTVQAVGEAIKRLSPDQQPAALLEATKRAGEAILHHGGAVVDGEIHQASTPQEAAKVAKKVMEGAIARHDEQAATQAQPVGSLDPATGRTILQPSKDPKVNQELATQEHPKMVSAVRAAVAKVPGAEIAATRPEKKAKRLDEKITGEGAPPETITDYSGAQVQVASPQVKDQVVAEIGKQLPVVEVDNKFDKGDDKFHYHQTGLQVQTPSGVTHEIQVVPDTQQEVNDAEHGDYKTAREAELKGDEETKVEAVAQAREKNDAAWQEFQQGAGAIDFKPEERRLNFEQRGAFDARIGMLRSDLAKAKTPEEKADVQYALDREIAVKRGQPEPEKPAQPSGKPTFAKGQTVTLSSGKNAIVKYHEPSMGRVRVQPEGSKGTITVKESEVKAAQEAAPAEPPKGAPLEAEKRTTAPQPATAPGEALVLPAEAQKAIIQDMQYELAQTEIRGRADFGIQPQHGIRMSSPESVRHYMELAIENHAIGQAGPFSPELTRRIVAQFPPQQIAEWTESIRARWEEDPEFAAVMLGAENPHAPAEIAAWKKRLVRAGTAGTPSLEGGVAAPEPGQVGTMATKDITVNANRFQFKLGTDAQGTSTLLKEQEKFNPDLAGVVSVWRDPTDGKVYVVNGHHRLELAKRTGESEIPVRHIAAPTAEAARALGALQNIAEGRGSAIDAAKFFRDSAMTPEDLKAQGLSMGESRVNDGAALARLDDTLFNRVASGDLREGRAIAIGEATADHAEQRAIVDLVDKREASGRKITDDTLRELIRLTQGSGKTTETTASLFGEQKIERSLAVEKAEVSAHVKQQISRDKKLFGYVAKQERATELARGGNVIDVNRSREISTGAAQAEEVYNKLSSRAGAVANTINDAARRLAEGENANEVKQRAYAAIREEISQTLGGREDSGASRVQADTGRGPALPGFERPVAEQQAAVEAKHAADLSGTLIAPPKSVSASAGKMERESPLFRDTEAGGNRNLFSEPGEPTTMGMSVPGVAEAAEALGKAAEPIKNWLGNKVERVREAKELNEGLADLQSQYQADVLRAVQTMKQVPGTAKDEQAIYHHLENPKEPITAEQQQILDQHIKPFMDEAQRIYTKLKENGVPAENYVHRVVQDKGSLIDRIMSGSKGSGQGNVLSKYAPATKHRTMMALTDAEGERTVVSVKGGRVVQWENGQPTDLGGLRSGLTTKEGLLHERIDPLNKAIRKLQHERVVLNEVKGRVRGEKSVHGVEPTFAQRKRITTEIDKLERQRDSIINSVGENELKDSVFIDKQGRELKFTQATTKEIEGNTGLKYYHNALGSAITNYLNMRKAERAYDYIEDLKASPEFGSIAVKQDAGNPPKDWRPSPLPQLRGYFFEPHTADVLDRYAAKLGKNPGRFEQIGQFLRTSIFFNPLIHVPNITVHFAVEKGVTGWMPWKWPTMFRAGAKAITAVTKQNADYLDALDHGAPMQYQRFQNKQFADLFFKKMAAELEGDPTKLQKVGKALGYANPVELVKAIYNTSGKVTWWTNDVAFLQATYEKTAGGMDFKEALNETAKHIPDYRLPAHVMGSRSVAKFMENPNFTMFSQYHYGALKSYGEMAKDAFGSDVPLKDRAHAMDIIAMLALMMAVVYPAADKLVQSVSGDKNARLRRAGATTFPFNLYQLAKGEKSPTDVATATLTPAVHFKAGVELAFNRNLRTGRQLYSPHEKAGTIARQIGRNVGAESISPIAQAARIEEDKSAARKFGYGLVGVSFPLHGAEKRAQDIAMSKLPTEAQTPQDRERGTLRKHVIEAAQKGDFSKLGDAVRAGALDMQQAKTIRAHARLNPLVARVWNFSYSEVKDVYNLATDEQKSKLRPLMMQKRERLLMKGKRAEVQEVEANP